MFGPSRSAVLIEEMCVAARAENRAIAAQLVKIGALFEMRLAEHGEERDYAVDTWAEVGAEIAAGEIDYRTFQAIVYRTELIEDEQKMAAADRRLALNAARWGSLSRSRLNAAIDRVVRRVDQDAVRRKREHLDNRDVSQ